MCPLREQQSGFQLLFWFSIFVFVRNEYLKCEELSSLFVFSTGFAIGGVLEFFLPWNLTLWMPMLVGTWVRRIYSCLRSLKIVQGGGNLRFHTTSTTPSIVNWLHLMRATSEMGLEPVPLHLEHVATNQSRNHHSTHLTLDGWNGGCDFGLKRHALTEKVRVQAPA